MLAALTLVQASVSVAQLPLTHEAADSQGIAPGPESRVVPPLQRPVTIVLHDVSLVVAVQVIDRQADLRLGYTDRILPAGKRVSLAVDLLPAREALAQVLQGTGVCLRETPDGQLVLTKGCEVKAESSSPQQE